MNFILILVNALLPILIQVGVMRLVKGVSGGDIFAFLLLLAYMAIHFFIVLIIFRKRKTQLKVSLIGLIIGIVVCIYLFNNHNNELEKVRRPHVEIGY